MNRLELAKDGFRNLSASLCLGNTEHTSDRAEAWLRDEVVPLVQELLPVLGFQSAVRWSYDRLVCGAQTSERQLVELVDNAMVAWATDLRDATTPDLGKPTEAPLGPHNAIKAVDRATIELIANRPWCDLVCEVDFYHPWQELYLTNPNPDHTTAFRKLYELRIPLGDYISRGMWARIEYWSTALNAFFDEAFLRGPNESPQAHAAFGRLFEGKIRLDEAIKRLRIACGTEAEIRRREACIVLLQVHTAYSLTPSVQPMEWWPAGADLGGGDVKWCLRRRGEIVEARAQANGVLRVIERTPASLCDPDLLRQVAAALEDITPLYEFPKDPDDQIEWARDRAQLVLVDRSSRAVYWNGAPVAEGRWDSHAREWDLLWTLAFNVGATVDQQMLMSPEKQVIKSRRNRLTKLLVGALDLDNQIETVRSLGYRLNLPAHQRLLLQDDGSGELRQVGRRRVLVSPA